MNWELVKYTGRHRAAVLALMAEVQGHATSPERFMWEFERNPVGNTNVCLAVAGGEVIGVSCQNAFRMRLAGRDQIVSFPLNVLTKAEHRGRGIFSRLELASEEYAERSGASLLLSFPNAASTPIFLERLGWLALTAPRLLARPCSVLRRRARLPVTIHPVQTVDHWADEIWAENDDLDRCMVRDSAYLTWRFIQCPDSNYRVFVVRDRNEIVGYMITGTTVKRRIPIAYIASALLTSSWRKLYPALRRAVLADARTPVLLDLETPFSTDKQPRPFGSDGHVPLPKHLNFIAKPIAQELDEPWLRVRPWFFQLGDLDFF